jgi:hypothetical protein
MHRGVHHPKKKGRTMRATKMVPVMAALALALVLALLAAGCEDEGGQTTSDGPVGQQDGGGGNADGGGPPDVSGDPLVGTLDGLYEGKDMGGNTIQGLLVIEVAADHALTLRVYTASGRESYASGVLTGSSGNTYTASVTLTPGGKTKATLAGSATIDQVTGTMTGTFDATSGTLTATGTWKFVGTSAGKPLDISGTWKARRRYTSYSQGQVDGVCNTMMKHCADGPSDVQECQDVVGCFTTFADAACLKAYDVVMNCWKKVTDAASCQKCMDDGQDLVASGVCDSITACADRK